MQTWEGKGWSDLGRVERGREGTGPRLVSQIGVTDWCHRSVSQSGLGAAGEPQGCFQRVGLAGPTPPGRGDSVGRALGVSQLTWACSHPVHLGVSPRTWACPHRTPGRVPIRHTWACSSSPGRVPIPLTWACPLALGRVPAHLGAPPPPHFAGEGPRWGGGGCRVSPSPPMPPPIPHLRARRRQAPPRAPLIGCGGRGGSLAMRARAAAPESAAAGAGSGARKPGSRTARREERAKPPETARNHG